MDNYEAEHIQILEGIEAVRKRPAMYIGDTGKKGFHHLLFEIVDNSIDEALAGFAKNIEVIIKKDNSVSVIDDGRGIPTEIHPSANKSTLEIVATVLHAGGKFDKKAYKISGGLHGVGLSVVNALSEWMVIEVYRKGKIYRQSYERGVPTSKVEEVGETDKRGTIVSFKPDQKIFEVNSFDYEYILERLRELAFLNKGIRIKIKDERENKENEFYFEGGILSFIEYLNVGKNTLHKPLYFSKKTENFELEIALQYTDGFSESIHSFANNIRTVEGGTHLSGFKSALTKVLNEYAEKNNYLKGNKRFSGEDVIEGLTAIISVKIIEPQFEGQTKTKLGNSEVKGLVESLFGSYLKETLEENPEIAREIIKKVILSLEAREAAEKTKELIRRKNIFETSVLPGKLADCIESDPAKCELFIVEGDSAGGSTKQARDKNTQAVLPLRGKILNVEKASIAKIFSNEEIENLVKAIGVGIGSEIDLKKLRYHKIIIMTDADVDGSHIRTLLLTFFYRYLKPLIENGHIYAAVPPLYRVKKGKIEKYVYNDEELKKTIENLGNDLEIQRYKGLGEMNPEQLWETTLNPATRILKKITLEDAAEADRLFSILMGEAVEPRKKFIEQYAKEVRNLDI